MDDGEEIENPVELSEKNWNRVIDAATKAGYREGIEEGKQSVFQEGFDIGYEDALKTAFLLGKYKGLATGLNGHLNTSSPVNEILEKTRRGACYICVKESEKGKDKAEDYIEPPLQELRNEQKIHSEKVIGTLHEHFENLLKERGLSVDEFQL